mgnify:CR=1 FL=1|tara:strand:- start:809 stop:1114 length:306 start_codon:yes stop_codon:yes gene_type:complete
MARRFTVANTAAPYTQRGEQILSVATKNGRHLHTAARVNGRITLTACGEFVTGRYDEGCTAAILAASGAAVLNDAVTCRHCVSISSTESARRKTAWDSTGM